MNDLGMTLTQLLFNQRFGFFPPKDFSGSVLRLRPFAVCTFQKGFLQVSETLYISKDWNCPGCFWVVYRKKAVWMYARQLKKWISQLRRNCDDFRRC